MKHLIIIGDGMADHPIERLGGKTPLQYADTPYMDLLAKKGRTGRLVTIPNGFLPGSEVANTAILGYDLNKVYEGRGPLEAASIGYEMQPNDMAMRCNILTLEDGRIKNHNGGHLTTKEGAELIKYLNENLENENIKFIPGIQYRHLLIIKGGNKNITCYPPHDHPNEFWHELLVTPNDENLSDTNTTCTRMTAQETADLINNLIIKSQELLSAHKLNANRKAKANSIWPWSPGYKPTMLKFNEMFPQVKSGAVISAVDLIRGIGYYAGLRNIIVPGATGLADTNYEGKAEATINALKTDDFVYLHIEASDEAGHDGDLKLKIKTIENLDQKIVGPIYCELEKWQEPICIAILPDHPTPVEIRTHINEPVPFIIYHKGIEPDLTQTYSEQSCFDGSYGLLRLSEFINEFMKIQ